MRGRHRRQVDLPTFETNHRLQKYSRTQNLTLLNKYRQASCTIQHLLYFTFHRQEPPNGILLLSDYLRCLKESLQGKKYFVSLKIYRNRQSAYPLLKTPTVSSNNDRGFSALQLLKHRVKTRKCGLLTASGSGEHSAFIKAIKGGKKKKTTTSRLWVLPILFLDFSFFRWKLVCYRSVGENVHFRPVMPISTI